jgi:hypothetical protein
MRSLLCVAKEMCVLRWLCVGVGTVGGRPWPAGTLLALDPTPDTCPPDPITARSQPDHPIFFIQGFIFKDVLPSGVFHMFRGISMQLLDHIITAGCIEKL